MQIGNRYQVLQLRMMNFGRRTLSPRELRIWGSFCQIVIFSLATVLLSSTSAGDTFFLLAA